MQKYYANDYDKVAFLFYNSQYMMKQCFHHTPDYFVTIIVYKADTTVRIIVCTSI